MKVDDLLAKLTAVRKAGEGWSARCPAHDDHRQSLTVAVGSDDRLLLRCHAGCRTADVVQALGLSLSDLFADRERRELRRVVARYDYRDEGGQLLFQVERLEPKNFRQRRPNNQGGWTYKLDGVRRVPYRLPELVAEPTRLVFIVEGEKDADRLAALGFLATTGPGGAGKWQEQFSKCLQGRPVAILPDNDAPGQKHADEVARSLEGLTAWTKVLQLPGLPEKGDVSDWLSDGGTAEQLKELVRSAPEWTPIPDEPDARAEARPDPIASLCGITKDITSSVLEDSLRRFAAGLEGMDHMARAVIREKAINLLREAGFTSPAKLIDAAMHPAVGDDQGNGALQLSDPEPWPESVDGAALLDELAEAVRRYVALPDGAAETVALWVVFAHAHDAFGISPLLVVASPEKRCGKTTLLIVVQTLVPRPLPTSNITSAALFRAVEAFRPTLLMDEAETFIRGDREDLRGILNSGHNRACAYVIRTVGEDHEPQTFTTWCPKVAALIGVLPPTIEDRAIRLPMRRKTASESVDRLRMDRLDHLGPLCRQAARWAADHLLELRAADPHVPEEIRSDRARDNWRPLLAIAEAVGGKWPDLACAAALALAVEETDAESSRVLLLRDLQGLFETRGADRLETKTIIELLIEMDDRPWSEIRRGKPINAHVLGRMLKAFGVKPTKWRDGSSTPRGYELKDLEDTFSRYIGGLRAPQAPPSQKQTAFPESKAPQKTDSVALSNAENSNEYGSVADVADKTPLSQGEVVL